MQAIGVFIIISAYALLSTTAASQSSVPDISVVYAQGKVEGYQYKNDYFGLTLTTPEAEFTKGGFISSQGKRARLIDAEANATKREDKYSVAILADALSGNPLIQSPTQYLRSVRHQFEREGLATIQEKSSLTISGLSFIPAVMKTRVGDSHYQGMYTTFLKGYIVSVQVEAPTAERLNEIMQTKVSFKNPDSNTRGSTPVVRH
jgi:hypothetical protein